MRIKLGLVAVVLTASFLAACASDATHVSLGERVTGSLRSKFSAIPHGAPAYLVGRGRVAGQPWYAAAFRREKQQCVATVGLAGASGSSCGAFASGSPIDELANGADSPQRRATTVRYLIGDTPPNVRTVFLRSDDGYEERARTVTIPGTRLRFFAIVVTGRLARREQTEVSGVTFNGEPVRNSPRETIDECPAAIAPLRGVADALPQAGQTTVKRVYDLARNDGDALLERYGATAIAAVSRNGQVWRRGRNGDVAVVDAADSMLRLWVPSAQSCPTEPQTYNGVPVQFQIGPAPSPVTAQPIPNPHR